MGRARLIACGAVRWYNVYPVGAEGWDLIFEPVGAAIVAMALVGRWVPAR